MPNESTLRGRARRQGLSVIKYRPTSRWYQQYGPYALADATNTLVAYGIADLDKLARELAS